jgi:hypothetical protein
MDEFTHAAEARAAFVTVGGYARGFVVETSHARLVITAAHCLPHLPTAHPAATEERAYANLLGPLGAPPSISAECVFADPAADLAVLCGPDGQELYDQSEAYERFVEAASALRIDVVTSPREAWLLMLDGLWERCSVRVTDNYFFPGLALTIVGATQGNAAGTSGSPIVSAEGTALGVISLGSLDGSGSLFGDQAGQPLLAGTLPGWLLAALNVRVENGGA